MDDSFLNNCLNPDIACGFKIHEQPPPPQSDSVMFGKISLKRLSDYPTEDAERFLSNFKAYATFNKLETNDRGQAAAFRLHIEGPAQSLFASLDDDITSDWDSLCAVFCQKYIYSDNQLFCWLKRNMS